MDGNQDAVDLSPLERGGGSSAVAQPLGRKKGAVRTRLYREGELIKEDFPPDEISDELRERHGCMIWLDLCQPDAEQLEMVAREFGLHQLAIEDVLEESQRTKIDRYRTHLFMSAYSANLDDDTGELITHEISAFITHHALITVRMDPAFEIDPVVERWDGSPDLAQYGVSSLLYGLLDYLVDGHFRAVEASTGRWKKRATGFSTHIEGARADSAPHV